MFKATWTKSVSISHTNVRHTEQKIEGIVVGFVHNGTESCAILKGTVFFHEVPIRELKFDGWRD